MIAFLLICLAQLYHMVQIMIIFFVEYASWIPVLCICLYIQAILYVLVRPLSKNMHRRFNKVVAELLWLETVWLFDWWAGVKVWMHCWFSAYIRMFYVKCFICGKFGGAAGGAAHWFWDISFDGWGTLVLLKFQNLVNAILIWWILVLNVVLTGKEHALLICNHRSDIDWLIGWVLAQVLPKNWFCN